jgi:hypothetical protein
LADQSDYASEQNFGVLLSIYLYTCFWLFKVIFCFKKQKVGALLAVFKLNNRRKEGNSEARILNV